MLSLAGLHAVIALRRLEYSNAAAEQTGMLQENDSILQENHTLRGAIFKAALSRKTRILQDELIVFLPLYFAGSFTQFGFDLEKSINP